MQAAVITKSQLDAARSLAKVSSKRLLLVTNRLHVLVHFLVSLCNLCFAVLLKIIIIFSGLFNYCVIWTFHKQPEGFFSEGRGEEMGECILFPYFL